MQSLRTTADLVSAIRGAVPASYRHGRIHFATRTFQALRIAVNSELDVLATAFRDAADLLSPGGRLCIISFHSLEDRIAKQAIRDLSQGSEPLLMKLNKKPVIASDPEVAANPRSRSAKLRIAERLPQRRCA
jgi:16S rRNA (cytosine1402-N4)-methyltransferase